MEFILDSNKKHQGTQGPRTGICNGFIQAVGCPLTHAILTLNTDGEVPELVHCMCTFKKPDYYANFLSI